MAARIRGAPLTSGGTENIFLALKSARDQARRRGHLCATPNIVVPASAHPAFDKAGQYLGLEVIRVPVAADLRADVQRMEAFVTRNTILIAASAPSFPYGMIDPVESLGRIALHHNLWPHVDACIGAFIAPFLSRQGYDLPAFDFGVPGVGSISADLHKYGFAPKGISAILYSDPERHSHQEFAFEGWQRGRYVTPGFTGTRPASSIAAAWAVMQFLGFEGYADIARRVVTTRRAIEAGVRDLGLDVVGRPELGILAYRADGLDMADLEARLEERGWHSGRLIQPAAIHLMITPAQEPVVDEYLADVAWALAAAGSAPPSGRREKVDVY